MAELSILKRESKKGFDMGVMAWFDRLMRTNYAAAGFAKASIEGKDPFKAVGRGLAGKDKTLFFDVLTSLGWKPTLPSEKAMKAIAGTGLDIVADPLTYVPVGGLLAKGGQKVVKKFPAVGRGIAAVRAAPPVQALGKALVPRFRPTGVNPEIWNKFLGMKDYAKNVERMGTKKAFDFSSGILTDINKLQKTGQFTEDTLGKLVQSVERRSIAHELPETVRPIFDKLSTYADDLAKRRGGIGKTLIDESDYDHWLHLLSEEERGRLKKLGIDTTLREYSTKSASDLHRNILRFTAIDDPKTSLITTAGKAKVVPLNIKGINEQHLKDVFSSTIKDISDLQDVAKTYGINIRFTKHRTTRGRALGSWQPKGRIFRIATGGMSEKGIVSTVAHELAHVVHGELGSQAALWTPSVLRLGAKKGIGMRGAWKDFADKVALLSDESKVGIWKALGYTSDYIKKNSKYLSEPTEIFARYIQVMKNNPMQAKKISPKLYETVMKVFQVKKGGGIDRKALNIFLGQPEFGEKFNLPQVYKNIKTGKLYNATQATIPEINKQFGREYFSTDVPFTSYIMGKRLAKQEAGTAFFDTVKDLGVRQKGLGLEASTAPELKGLYFNSNIAKEIDHVRKAFVGEETTQEFVKHFDKVQGYWKLQTLGLFPSYHVRNFIGNIWNNFLGGVVNPQVYQEAYDVLLKVHKKIPLSKAEKELYESAIKHGVLGRGIMGSEVPKLAPQKAVGIEKTVRATRRPAEMGMRFGEEFVEDPARMAHYIDKLKKKWSPEEAALSVKKYLFDYTELTPFEGNVLRRLMPFYTWTRKNIPLQVEAFLKQPGKPLSFVKLREEMGKAAGVTEEEKTFLPEWVKKRLPFFVPTKGKEKRFFPVESWLPLGDLMKLGRPQDIAGELLTPFIKIPVEMTTNKVYYFGREIQEHPGQTKEMFRRDIPAYVEYLMRQVRLLNEVDRLIGYKDKAPGQPPSPTIKERIIRTGTGVKTYRFDLTKAKRTRAWEIRKELEKLRVGMSRAKKWGRGAEANRILGRISDAENRLQAAQ